MADKINCLAHTHSPNPWSIAQHQTTPHYLSIRTEQAER